MQRIEDLLRDSDVETALIVLSCRVYLGTSEVEELNHFIDVHAADLNYDRVYQLARKHRIRPVVHKVLVNCAGFPEKKVIGKLGDDCRVITIKALNNLKEMFRVIAALKSRGVTVLPYRGPLFSKMYFGDWAMRESSDLDFLIDKKDIAELSFLKDEGYKAKHIYNDYRDIDIHKNSKSIDLNNDVNGKRNIHLEFHYNIVAECYGVRSGYEEAATCVFDGGGQSIKVLSNESSAGIILAHHGLQDIWASLKYYMDLAVLVRNPAETDWQKVIEFTRKHGFYKLSTAAFYNMELLTGVKNPLKSAMPDTVYAARLLELCLAIDKYASRGFHKLELRIEGRDSLTWKLKMRRGLITLFLRPSTEDFEWKYFPKPLFWLYYVCKPPRLVYTYLIQPLIGKRAAFPFR